MMWRIGLAALAATLVSGAASGQTAAPDPVKTAYKAYLAARDREDLPGAEAAAAAALEASEARDGEGGSTGVLALNLAIVRLERDHPAEAVKPAREAVELAAKGAKGLDGLQARLVLGEAELLADPKADEAPLLKALQEADGRTDLDEVAYPAALALANAATTTDRLANRAEAWRVAAIHAAGSPDDPALARARAQFNQALALTRAKKWEAAYALVVEAGRALVKLAPEQAEAGALTIGEKSYADALALQAALRPHVKPPAPGNVVPVDRAPPAGRPPLCTGGMLPHPIPDVPLRSLERQEMGALTLRFVVDKTGRARGPKVVSTLAADDYRRAFESKDIEWRLERGKDAAPNCRMDSNDRLVPVVIRRDGD